MTESRCSIGRITLADGINAITLTTPQLVVTVLSNKGADIYSLVHRPTGIDVLWKSPIGLRAPGQGHLSTDSSTAWHEMYEGGWQEILPNGGDACQYRGVELNYHGESTFFFQAEDGIRDHCVTGVQTCALPICIADGEAARLAKV